MKTAALTIFLVAPLAFATEQTNLSAPAPAQPVVQDDRMHPALLKDTTINSDDSPLVRAAKSIVAARQSAAAATAVSVTTTRGTGKTSARQLGVAADSAQAAPAASGQPGANKDSAGAAAPAASAAPTKAELTSQKEQLVQQLNHARMESDEPFGQNQDEGLTERQLHDNPLKIEQLDQQLKATPDPNAQPAQPSPSQPPPQ